MIWVADGTSGAIHVGTFTSMDECKKAASEQELVGSPQNAPQYSFVCVRAKQPQLDGGARNLCAQQPLYINQAGPEKGSQACPSKAGPGPEPQLQRREVNVVVAETNEKSWDHSFWATRFNLKAARRVLAGGHHAPGLAVRH